MVKIPGINSEGEKGADALAKAFSVKARMVVASLMILARPEGFFPSLQWGIWVLAETKPADGKKWSLSFFSFGTTFAIPLLATGAFIWWLAALIITGDRLFIRNNCRQTG